MTRLHTELQRLYGLPAPADTALADGRPGHDADAGPVRRLVLELAAPADWPALSALWQGVQADLGLPAPAIAVSGTDGYQLWFALAVPVAAAEGAAFLAALQARWLAALALPRVRLWPTPAGGRPPSTLAVPAPQGAGEAWSAFVSPDLAPMFADTPWLDMPPNPEGQAGLLTPLRPIGAEVWAEAWDRLVPPVDEVAAPAAPVPVSAAPPAGPGPAGWQDDPRRFLLGVMNDPRADLALRIEAAKALLPGC